MGSLRDILLPLNLTVKEINSPQPIQKVNLLPDKAISAG